MTRTYGPAILSKAGSSLALSPISLVTGTERPRLVSGLGKLVQQVCFLLLTDIDSIEGLPGIGASPIESLTTMTTGGDLEAVDSQLAETAAAIVTQLAQLRSVSAPDDEIIDSLELSAGDYDRESGSLTITVRLSSAAGETAEYEITR